MLPILLDGTAEFDGSLARLEAIAVLDELCARVSGVRLADDYAPDPNPVFWANGHRSLRAVLTPATGGPLTRSR